LHQRMPEKLPASTDEGEPAPTWRADAAGRRWSAMRRWLLLLVPLVALALLVGTASTDTSAARWQGMALGVCWEGSPRPIDADAVAPLAALHANALSQTPFAFMRDPKAPSLSWRRDGTGWWGERAEGVRFLSEAARAHDIGTLLKPHVWLHGSWPGEVEMTSEADWAAWFAAYREFLLAWAR